MTDETPTVPPAPGSGTLPLPESHGSLVAQSGGYDILSELARGGMGVVYKARDRRLGRTVALKMILAGSHAGTDERNRFEREARAAAALSHPGIVPVFEVGELDGQPFLALEFVDGPSLHARLANGPLPPGEAAAIVKKVAEAVAYAHSKGIVHRDLKPHNVLIGPDSRPRVTDFGLAKRIDVSDGMTGTGQILGTPQYMAPEQAAGSKDVGPAADVYALGALLYALLTGRPPFQAATVYDILAQVVGQDPVAPRQLNPKIDRDLETIALKCLVKQPAKRYPSAGELAADLGRYLAGEPVLARRPLIADNVIRWSLRRPLVAAAAAVATTVVCLTVATLTLRPGLIAQAVEAWALALSAYRDNTFFGFSFILASLPLAWLFAAGQVVRVSLRDEVGGTVTVLRVALLNLATICLVTIGGVAIRIFVWFIAYDDVAAALALLAMAGLLLFGVHWYQARMEARGFRRL